MDTKINRYQAIIAILVVVIMKLVGIVYNYRTLLEADLESCNDIVKTVAHIDLSKTDLQLIYSDTDNDIAYYKLPAEKKLVNTGDELTTTYSDVVEVVYTDIYGFKVKDSNHAIYPGMSGTALLDSDNNVIGYVSTLLDNDEVYCIWE